MTRVIALVAALLMAGCASAPTDDPTPTTPTDARLIHVPINLAGRTPTATCAGMPGFATPCPDIQRGDFNQELPEGLGRRLLVNVTWESDTDLSVVAYLIVADDRNRNSSAGDPETFGEQPFAVDWDLSDFDGRELKIGVLAYAKHPDPTDTLVVYYGIDYRIEGEMLARD